MAHFSARREHFFGTGRLESYVQCELLSKVPSTHIILNFLPSPLELDASVVQTPPCRQQQSHTWYYLCIHTPHIFFNVVNLSHIEPLHSTAICICSAFLKNTREWIFILLCIYAILNFSLSPSFPFQCSAASSEWWHVNQSSSHKYFTCLLFHSFSYMNAKNFYTLTRMRVLDTDSS